MASAVCTVEASGGGHHVSLLVVAALAYPVPAPKTFTEVKLDAYEHKIKYVETERNRWKVWLRDGDAFYYANAPAKAQTTRLAMQELSAVGIKFEPQPSTWLSRSIDMELALLGVVATIIAFLAALAALYHYYYEIYKKKHAYPIESYKPDPKETVVEGHDEEKEALQLIVDFVRDPVAFERTGLPPPRGVLLIGDPGVGKTSLARWLAVTAGCPFIVFCLSIVQVRGRGCGAHPRALRGGAEEEAQHRVHRRDRRHRAQAVLRRRRRPRTRSDDLGAPVRARRRREREPRRRRRDGDEPAGCPG